MKTKSSLWDLFKRPFFSGLIVFVPLSLTIYFFRLLFLLISQTLLPPLLHQHWVPLPMSLARPLSFFLTIFLIWSLGLVTSNWLGKRLVSWVESLIHRIPIFRGMYEAIQSLTAAFFGRKSLYQSVVLVEYPRKGVYTFGFVTSHLSGKLFHSSEAYLCVFIPTVPNPTSGLLLYIPKSETIALSLSIEDTAKILVSHGFVSLEEKAVRSHKEG
jgi:uncharacterized membrane protein